MTLGSLTVDASYPRRTMGHVLEEMKEKVEYLDFRNLSICALSEETDFYIP